MPSAEHGFRNKAKMAVAGTADDPTLGILDRAGHGTDLRGCPLHTPGIVAALPVLAAFVTRAGLTPYDVPTRRGELKYLLVTEGDGLMVRFVLRSTEALARIRKHLPGLLDALGTGTVVSVNLQPEHKAVLEGAREIPLAGEALAVPLGDVVLHLRPQSFFQTNTDVARSAVRRRAGLDRGPGRGERVGPVLRRRRVRAARRAAGEGGARGRAQRGGGRLRPAQPRRGGAGRRAVPGRRRRRVRRGRRGSARTWSW